MDNSYIQFSFKKIFRRFLKVFSALRWVAGAPGINSPSTFYKVELVKDIDLSNIYINSST